ncbi:MAG: PaRep2b protein, partial [Thermofilaceae archaeon]
MLKAVTPALPKLYGLRDALAEFADVLRDVTREAIKRKFGIDLAYDVRNKSFSKIEEVVTMTDDYVYRNVTVES